MSKAGPIVQILNTTNETKILRNIKFEYKPISGYDIYDIPKETKSKKDFSKLQDLVLENNSHLKSPVVDNLIQLIKTYEDVFASDEEKLTTNNFYRQKLRLSDETPVYTKNYRLPHSQKDEIKSQIQNLLDNDIIEPSFGEYSSPILLVPKKSDKGENEKKWRLVVDFRRLNKKLVRDVYPIPRIDDILDQLGRAKYFSILDLQSGFHQIELDEESRDYTAFQTDQGSFRFTRVPFGLKVSPNSFARMMSLAFAGLAPEKAFLYMDDIIVIGCSEKHHLSNLQSVFEKCRKFNLKLNPRKCKFFRHEVTYLGHKCTRDGVTIDDSKIQPIRDYPQPTNSEETKRFVAFANYYRKFIKNFATITNPLNKLTRKNVEFHWNDQCRDSFEKIKTCLSSSPILVYPDFGKEFVIVTDACKTGVGGTLCQDYDGILKPISFFSKSFTKGEANKATIEQELLGVYFSIMYFRSYIYGKKFRLLTDHKPLIYLFSLKNPSSRLTRIRIELEEYDFVIEHIAGKDNCVSDALSRIEISDLKKGSIENNKIYVITRSMSGNKKENQKQNENEKLIKNETESKPIIIYNQDDSIDRNIAKFLSIKQPQKVIMLLKFRNEKKNVIVHEYDLTRDKIFDLDQMLNRLNEVLNMKGVDSIKIFDNDLLFEYIDISKLKAAAERLLVNKSIIISRAPKILENETDITEILKRYHDDPISGAHCGIKRTLSKIKTGYYFRNMFKRVKNYIKACKKCKLNKVGKATREKLIITETPNKAFDTVQIDTVGRLSTTENDNKYILTMQCELTKYIILTPLKDKSATTVAQAIFRDLILRYGPPKAIKTDQGTELINEVVKEICKLLNVTHKASTPYHHETMGGIERNHRELNTFFRNYLKIDNDWDCWLPVYAFAYNTTPSYYHSFTPFELVFGKKANLVEEFLVNNITPIYNTEDYSKLVRHQLEVTLKKAKTIIEKEKERRKNVYDSNTNPIHIKVGDKIHVKNQARHKFENFYNGPFEVIEVLGNNNIKYKNNDKEIIVHKNNVIFR